MNKFNFVSGRISGPGKNMARNQIVWHEVMEAILSQGSSTEHVDVIILHFSEMLKMPCVLKVILAECFTWTTHLMTQQANEPGRMPHWPAQTAPGTKTSWLRACCAVSRWQCLVMCGWTWMAWRIKIKFTKHIISCLCFRYLN